MRVLIFPRDLELGGSSINAIDLAAAVREHGHDTMVFANRGPLEQRVTALGLPFQPAEVPQAPRPSLHVMRALAAAVRRHRIDLVHTYEYWPCVEAFCGPGLLLGRPVLATILSMELPSYLPRSVPVAVGTRDLVDTAERSGQASAYLIEPPVDTAADRPGLDTSGFAAAFGLAHEASPGPDDPVLTVAIVSRVATQMKQESIERAMDAVALLAPSRAVRLLVVGDGSAMADVSGRAAAINDRIGKRAVVLTGALVDPRPAYAFADIVVGMGSSVLRGMAFAKPAVVVGERGFSMPVTPENMAVFDRTGFYGVDGGRPAVEEDPLVDQLRQLVDDAPRRRRLGEFGLETVRQRYSLPAAAARLDRAYRQTVADRPGAGRRAQDALWTAARIVRHKAAGRGLLRGTNQTQANEGGAWKPSRDPAAGSDRAATMGRRR
jgi:glycosyltransferase involved in cell wall biosynthesis